jgi:hypothetical protein
MTRPPGLAAATANPTPASVPAASKATSTPRPPVASDKRDVDIVSVPVEDDVGAHRRSGFASVR